MTKDESTSMTIGEYAEANDLQMAVVGIGNAAAAEGVEGIVSSLDWRLEADGTLVFMLSGEAPQGAGDVLEVALSCNVTPLVPASEGEGITMQYYEPGAEEPTSSFIGYDADAENVQRGELTFALSAAGASESPACELSAEYPGCGVRVDGVEFSLSPMAAYYEIHYTVVDEAAYAATEDGLWFEFLDESGERLPSGATWGGEVTQQTDGSFVQRGSLSARGDLSRSRPCAPTTAGRRNATSAAS